MSASEIDPPAWPSNSELRLEAMRELPAHRRLCPFEGFRRGLDSLHKKLGAPSDGVAIRVLRRGQRQPRICQTGRRPLVGTLSGSLVAFTLRGPRMTGGRRHLPDGASATQVKEACDESA